MTKIKTFRSFILPVSIAFLFILTSFIYYESTKSARWIAPGLKLVHEVDLINGSWIQEIYNDGSDLYSIACIRDKSPRLYQHSSLEDRVFIKNLCEAPEGFEFHKGLAIIEHDDLVYAFVNLHDQNRTHTGLYTGSSITDLSFVSLASSAGLMNNTQVNFRIRDVWFNETDNLFYSYYDGSSLWKGHHFYVFLGRSPDPIFEPHEFIPLYEGGTGWNQYGIYAPNIYQFDDYALGAVKGYSNREIPYNFDCDLVMIPKPTEIIFFSDLEGGSAYFESIGQPETQAGILFEYQGSIYIASRFTENGQTKGRIYLIDPVVISRSEL